MSHPHLNKTLIEDDKTGDLYVAYQATAEFSAPRWDAGVTEPAAVHESVRRAAWASLAIQLLVAASDAASRAGENLGVGGLHEMIHYLETKSRAEVDRSRA